MCATCWRCWVTPRPRPFRAPLLLRPRRPCRRGRPAASPQQPQPALRRQRPLRRRHAPAAKPRRAGSQDCTATALRPWLQPRCGQGSRDPVRRRPAAPLQLGQPFKSFGDEVDDGQVRVVTPEDTQTLTDIRLDRQTNAPPCFAVQLVWSVTPIDITKLPHLAIFDAYTLYNVEGNRQGRRWYGLRLGFFSDPNSATQVAYYVRSDYPKVAVVPVATRERERADGGDPHAVQGATGRARRSP